MCVMTWVPDTLVSHDLFHISRIVMLPSLSSLSKAAPGCVSYEHGQSLEHIPALLTRASTRSYSDEISVKAFAMDSSDEMST